MCYLPAKSTSSACEHSQWLEMAMEVDSKARSIAREDGIGGGTQWLVPPGRALLGKNISQVINSVLHLAMFCLSFSSLVLDF